jgi:predicted SAM-dependent methyltransferase
MEKTVFLENLDVRLSELDSKLLWGYAIDFPRVGTQTNPYAIDIRGWVLGKSSPVIEVELVKDNAAIQNISVCQSRPDVAKLYPGVPLAEKCGFSKEVEIGRLPAESDFLLNAVLQDNTRLTLGVVRLKQEAHHWDRRQQQRWQIASQYLFGKGIEIGGLHSPLKVPANAKVSYVDRMSVSDLKKHYSNFDETELVKVDIVDDGEFLLTIPDASVDFVIANHMIEHCENPLVTIENYLRVLKLGGIIYMAVPDKRYSFDIDRPVTSLEHLIRDYKEGPQWSRREHFEEWVTLVEKTQTNEVEKRIQQLFAMDHRIHFHVWTQEKFLELLLYCHEQAQLKLEIELVQKNLNEFITVLRKI